MAEFGWAYVSGLVAGGVSGSVQTNDGTSNLTGSTKLVYDDVSQQYCGSAYLEFETDQSQHTATGQRHVVHV